MEKIIKEKAVRSIQRNLLEIESGTFISAGANQFRTLWVRDFCYSVPGLLLCGFTNLVEKQLLLILQFQRSDGLLPRGLDWVDPKIRVLWNTLFRGVPAPYDLFPKKVFAEYMGEHQTIAFDSNLLFLRAACQLSLKEKKELILNHDQIRSLLNFYQPFFIGCFLQQPKYSDWQDSASREGILLLSQLLYLDVIHHLERCGYNEFDQDIIQKMRMGIMSFYDADIGLFRDRIGQKQFSLDANILLLKSLWILPNINHKQIYLNLKNCELWGKTIPGCPTWPEYSENEISWTCKLAGLRHYHDGYIWGWLAAEAAKVAYLYNDIKEYERIVEVYSKSNTSEYLAEVYNIEDLRPVKKIFYKSEQPFTWTAAKWLEAFDHSV